jgi:TM2 domain-containing membrane protein YozV
MGQDNFTLYLNLFLIVVIINVFFFTYVRSFVGTLCAFWQSCRVKLVFVRSAKVVGLS